MVYVTVGYVVVPLQRRKHPRGTIFRFKSTGDVARRVLVRLVSAAGNRDRVDTKNFESVVNEAGEFTRFVGDDFRLREKVG